MCVVFFFLTPTVYGQTAESANGSADELMAKVFERDTEREKLSQGYSGSRHYVFDNERFGRHAELTVSIKCDLDGTKHFEVVSEEGWETANRRVLRRMLDSETETSRPEIRPKTRLISANYSFVLVQGELIEGRLTYAIDVAPKRRDKYLIEGRIWVDARDYAVIRAEGKPSKNPSIWTRSIHFVHQYQKSGDFWFPARTESITEVRIFGKTDVTIRYFDYAPNTNPAPAPSARSNASAEETTYAAR